MLREQNRLQQQEEALKKKLFIWLLFLSIPFHSIPFHSILSYYLIIKSIKIYTIIGYLIFTYFYIHLISTFLILVLFISLFACLHCSILYHSSSSCTTTPRLVNSSSSNISHSLSTITTSFSSSLLTIILALGHQDPQLNSNLCSLSLLLFQCSSLISMYSILVVNYFSIFS